METIKFDGRTYKIEKGKPLGNVPKCYGKSIGVVRRERFTLPGVYPEESGLVSIFCVNGSLRYETYRDGCIFPFYGMLVEVQEQGE